MTEFFQLMEKSVFQVIMANINAILSTLESLGKDPQEHIDDETRDMLKVNV